MTDRENLIEKAAKAILDANDIHPDDPNGDHGYYAKTWEYAVQDAEAALAVFEQAHTPTSDEREALANLIPLGFRAQDGVRNVFDAADRILAAGFRHPEVPGEREAKIHGELVTMRVKEWRRITDELARLRTMEGQLEVPEPRAEPTDVQRAAQRWANSVPIGPESAPIQAFEAGWSAALRAQAEPTDVMFNVAAQRFYGASGLDIPHTYKPEIVAGLHAAWDSIRAAFKAGGEGR